MVCAFLPIPDSSISAQPIEQLQVESKKERHGGWITDGVITCLVVQGAGRYQRVELPKCFFLVLSGSQQNLRFRRFGEKA